MVKISYKRLKNGGSTALNVGYGQLYDDTVSIIQDIFKTPIKVYKMRLSKLCGKGVNKNKDKFKYEPIIVAKKYALDL